MASYSVVRGFQKLCYWEDMEPTRDNYDFSAIKRYLDYLHSMGKYLAIQLQFKVFTTKGNRVPDYIKTENFNGGNYYGVDGGMNIQLWNDSVMARVQALIKAMGDSLDNHPALALINLNESSVSAPLDSVLKAEWDSQGLRMKFLENMASLGTNLRDAFPNTPTLSYNNEGELVAKLFEENALSSGNGHGGPDTYVSSLKMNLWLRHSYRLGQRLAGKVPIGYAVQWFNYTNEGIRHRDPRGYVPIKEIYEFSRDVLHSNYMFWQIRNPYWSDVKAFLSDLSTSGDPAGGLNAELPEKYSE